VHDPAFISNLRFGDGKLLRDGTADFSDGRSLQGRYIVRVGWDDVRGWFSEVSTLFAHLVFDFVSIPHLALLRRVKPGMLSALLCSEMEALSVYFLGDHSLSTHVT
jgi:hypothetical protein